MNEILGTPIAKSTHSFGSNELNLRPTRAPDHELQSRALTTIACSMADSPREALQRFVEIAQEICHAGSAGLSVVSGNNGNCEWPVRAGAWSQCLATLRGGAEISLATLQSGSTQLLVEPTPALLEFDPASPPIVEALLTPVFVEKKAVGVLWLVSHSPERKFDSEDRRLVESLGILAATAFSIWDVIHVAEQFADSLRQINQELVVSMVRQQELADDAHAAQAALRESQQQLTAELAAMRHLQEISTQLVGEEDIGHLYERILNASVDIMGADFAAIHILYPGQTTGGELFLIEAHGLPPPARAFWEWVGPDSPTTCGTALRSGQRTVVPDVHAASQWAGTRDLELSVQAGIRAAQSTPLVSRNGKILGMISTHWRQVHAPSDRDLQLMDVLARLAADLMERTQSQTALRNLNSDLRHFSYTVSHDLQEPLRMVITFTQLLAERYADKLDERALGYVMHAVTGAKRMDVLLHELRDYWLVSERAVEKLVPVDLQLVLDQALTHLEMPIRETNAVVTHDPLPRIIAEEFPLVLLLQNLIGNAIKYQKPGVPPHIHVSAKADNAGWAFSVKDNGMGIPTEYLQSIFEPFKRLHGKSYPGTGLGLAMCQRVIARYRGRIWAESTVGEGSTFSFTIPASQGTMLTRGGAVL